MFRIRWIGGQKESEGSRRMPSVLIWVVRRINHKIKQRGKIMGEEREKREGEDMAKYLGRNLKRVVWGASRLLRVSRSGQ